MSEIDGLAEPNGHKEPRTIPVQFGTGRPWQMPVEQVKTLLAELYRASPRRFGEALLTAQGIETGRQRQGSE